ncbi:MAG: UDP-glucose/GDP-mannose dehydrogenase family protein [Rhodobacteraceae bacterium]|nr:UDP-glucose/GDP-mannose dehydrogenase family protein [Paracoccaceae bacterium]
MKNIGIIGNGFVGSAIASGFALHTKIRIYDKDVCRSTHTLTETINKSDFVFISVPTPMIGLMGGKIDLTIMDNVFEEISLTPKDSNFSYEDVIFIVKSTVVPGTIERYIDRYPNMRIAFSPEFLTERSAYLDFINTARIVIGASEETITDDIESLFRVRFPYTTIIKTDVATAQFIKYMANCFFSVKLSFMNEMFQAAEAFGINWTEAQRGFITDGRIGNSHIDVPGHDGSRGFGGKCFPKDLNAFIGFFEEIGIEPTVLKAAWEKNLEVRDNLDWKDIPGAVSGTD